MQLDTETRALGAGFRVLRLEAGSRTAAHTHKGDEELYIIDGILQDHDGYKYKTGDVVWLRDGTVHSSYTERGCVLVAFGT